MASVYFKDNAWYLRYKDEAGRWRACASEARTKTEAKKLAYEKERKAERVRLGVDPAPIDSGNRTVADLLSWWLENFLVGKPSYEKSKSAISCHLLGSPVGTRRAAEVTAGEIERFLEQKRVTPGKKGKPLGPQSLNHLREFMRRAFKAALKERMIGGANPVEEVKRWKVPKRKPDFLRFHEVPIVLEAIRPDYWRPLFATAIYTGLRKGELLGLRKRDVDLDLGQISVERSYDRDTTKGGHADAIPIAAELRPYLEQAIAASPSELVFPKEDGTMRPEGTQLEVVLRRALRRAGIVLGYRHKCRKEGCGHVEASTEATIRSCPKDGRKMWVTSVVRPITFHELRHTTGSLLTMRGANTAFVQRIMRHSDPRITTGTYCHLEPSYLSSGIDQLLRFQPEPAAAPVAAVASVAAGAPLSPPAANGAATAAPTAGSSPPLPSPIAAIGEAGPLVTGLLRHAAQGPSGDPGLDLNPKENPATSSGAGYRVRTDDIQLGKLTLYQLS